jgi:hypothetical protein
MSNKKHNKSIKDTVLAQIKSGQASMKPRWHFVLKAVLTALGVFIVASALLYLVSFILFMLRQTGIFFVPSFGFKGVGVFLLSLPWFLILISIAFFVVLEILVKRYSFTYKKPLFYSLIGIIIFVTAGSLIVSQAGVHKGLSKYAQERGLPVAGRLYQGYDSKKIKDIHIGTVDEVTDNGFTMTSRRGETLIIVISDNTRFPTATSSEKGDKVVVMGKRDADVIKADGIRQVNDEILESLRRR